MELVDRAVAYLNESFLSVNNPKGLLIALVASLFVGTWLRLVPIAIVAVIVHIVIDALIPVLTGAGGIAVPEFTQAGFWSRALALLAGYAVILAILQIYYTLKQRFSGK